MSRPSINNFYSKIFIPEDKNLCWIWKAGKTKKGYGRIRYKGKRYLSHRFSYIQKFGGIPEDICVCHRCDNPTCVNPNHLFLGTVQDNNKDRDLKGRQVALSGEKQGSSKLTSRQVLEIRKRRKNGEKLQDIADDYGITFSCVSVIARGKAWKHLK